MEVSKWSELGKNTHMDPNNTKLEKKYNARFSKFSK
jgi:hypothetical protein